MRRPKRGLTLIEIVVVIAIVSMLTAAVGVYAIGTWEHSKRRTALLDVHNAATSLDLYRAQMGHYPTKEGDFESLVATKVLKQLPRDPWGHLLTWQLVDGTPVVRSYGADGRPGGQDLDADLTSDVDEEP